MSTPTFAEQLAGLPSIAHLAAVELLDAGGTVVAIDIRSAASAALAGCGSAPPWPT